MEKGIAVLVTYNRIDCLRKSVACLLKQTYAFDELIIVDNASTDGTAEYLDALSEEEDRVIVEHMDENTGGSGGFHRALKLAYDRGADWIWGMDDDAYAAGNALEKLLEVRKNISEKDAYWSNPNRDDVFENGYKTVNDWMFVGFFVSREIIDKAGFPRGDFFIYYDDHEYAERIRNAGFKIYKVKDSVIEHRDAVSDVTTIELFGRKTDIVHMPKQPWKAYYLVRNDMLRHKKGSAGYRKSVWRSMRRICKSAFAGPKIFKATLKGYRDGKNGVAGKTVSP